jgi:hypothetical protein
MESCRAFWEEQSSSLFSSFYQCNIICVKSVLYAYQRPLAYVCDLVVILHHALGMHQDAETVSFLAYSPSPFDRSQCVFCPPGLAMRQDLASLAYLLFPRNFVAAKTNSLVDVKLPR